MPIAVSNVRFGTFELEIRSGELRKDGRNVRLQEQPLQVLILLLEHAGEVVTREDLQHKLWPSDTFVDFEHGLNAAVKRLRETLGDDADHPVYIETLPKHGYRWVAPVVPANEAQCLPRNVRTFFATWRWMIASVAGAVLLIAFVAWPFFFRGSTRSSGIYSLAVLPFENLSGKLEDERFSDGLTEQLINQLGRTQSLRIVSRQSVMHYKGAVKTLPQIAAELNVQAIVQGSVLRNEGRVRITLQLVRAVPEQHLWADSYERDLGDVIDLQREIAVEVAKQVRLAVTNPATPGRRPRP